MNRRDKISTGALMLVFGGLAASQPVTAQGMLVLVAAWGLCRMVKAFAQKDPPAK